MNFIATFASFKSGPTKRPFNSQVGRPNPHRRLDHESPSGDATGCVNDWFLPDHTTTKPARRLFLLLFPSLREKCAGQKNLRVN